MTETVNITVTMKAVAVTLTMAPTETVISKVTLTRDSESN